jgi:hypothetical protein
MKVTQANKVRLWCAAACQGIGLILLMSVPTPDGSYYVYTSTQNGIAMEWWAFIFLAAAATLAGISLYRFLRPAAVLPQAPPPYKPPYEDQGVNPYSGMSKPPEGRPGPGGTHVQPEAKPEGDRDSRDTYVHH